MAAIRATVTRYGRLDVLHNNAALTESDFLSRDTQVTDLSLEVWERTMAVNLRSQMLMCKHAIPEMVARRWRLHHQHVLGRSLKGDRTRTAYGVSKAGVNTLTMYVATAHGKQGVRVNTIVPGLIITDAVRAHLTERMLAGLGRATLTPYVGEPDDVANLVVFLASDESRYITGQMIAIDGGMSAHVGFRRAGRPIESVGGVSGRPEDVGAVLGVVVPAARGLGPAVDMDGLARSRSSTASPARKTAAPAISSTWPGRPMGTVRPKRCLGPGRRHRRHALGQGDVGGQGVHPDAVGGELERGGLGEVDDPGFGRRVGGVPGCGPDPLDRGHADDAAAGSRFDHRPGHPLGAEDDVLEVGPVERVPAVLRGLEDRREEDAPGVVDQNASPVRARPSCGPGRRRPRPTSRTSVVRPSPPTSSAADAAVSASRSQIATGRRRRRGHGRCPGRSPRRRRSRRPPGR